jgi:hypothetical protein
MVHPALIVGLKHLRGYVIHWIGNITEEKSRMFNRISGLTVFVPQRTLKMDSSNFLAYIPYF